MKKQGMLNSHISQVLAELGHTDTIVIADAGLPIPHGVKRIDLALKQGTPTFLETLAAVLEDMEVEKITLANEIEENNPSIHEGVKQLAAEMDAVYVDHETFKTATQTAKAVIRTGEVTPYANVILHAGVIF